MRVRVRERGRVRESERERERASERERGTSVPISRFWRAKFVIGTKLIAVSFAPLRTRTHRHKYTCFRRTFESCGHAARCILLRARTVDSLTLTRYQNDSCLPSSTYQLEQFVEMLKLRKLQAEQDLAQAHRYIEVLEGIQVSSGPSSGRIAWNYLIFPLVYNAGMRPLLSI